MKRSIFFLILIFSVIFFGCRERGIKGSGDVTTQEREIDEFAQLEVSGAYNINLEVGRTTSLKISAEDNLQKFIKVEVINEKLVIENTRNILPKRKIEIDIITEDLEAISSSGISNIIAEGIDEQRFDIDLSGAGVIELYGKVETLNVNLSGAALLEAKELFARFVDIDISGAANAEVNASERLTADLSANGNLLYFGDPLDVVSNVSGVGEITKGEW